MSKSDKSGFWENVINFRYGDDFVVFTSHNDYAKVGFGDITKILNER